MLTNDINEEYLNDPYENRPNSLLRTQQLTQDLNTFDAYFHPNLNYMNIKETENFNNNFNSNKMNSNEAQISSVNETKINNADKKKAFAEKLRMNASKKIQRKNTVQQGDEFETSNHQVNQSRMSKKSKTSNRKRPSSSDSSSSSSSSYSSSTSSRSRSLTPPPTRKPNKSLSKISIQKKVDTSKEKIVPPMTPPKPKYTAAEQADKLRTYQLQGFHPYYDREADVLGLACCTCCISKCKKADNCCRGCSNLISCPVYCWLLAILPTLVLLIAGIIVLALVGAKIIK